VGGKVYDKTKIVLCKIKVFKISASKCVADFNLRAPFVSKTPFHNVMVMLKIRFFSIPFPSLFFYTYNDASKSLRFFIRLVWFGFVWFGLVYRSKETSNRR